MSGTNKRIQRTYNRFSEVPKADTQRSTFNRSHGHKTTFDADRLIPVFVDDVLPGDTYTMKLNAFARLATPLHPTMDNLYIDHFAFFVPNRLVWSNWEKHMGEQTNPGDSTDFTIPQIECSQADWDSVSLYDYMGIPRPADGESHFINALPFRAYARIWNEFFRDQNLTPSQTYGLNTGDGPDASPSVGVLKRSKKHDYFTSALPWPQKGDPVALPLGSEAPVYPDSLTRFESPGGGQPFFDPAAMTTPTPGGTNMQAALDPGGTPQNWQTGPGATWPGGAAYWGETGLAVDLSEATGATINELRQAFQIQRMLERDARSGTRYTEVIKAHFNVTSPDSRLQRPEILSLGTNYVQMNPVAQTSPTSTDVFTSNTPQANLAAVGTASIGTNGFHKSFTEHGFIIVMVCARPDLTYQHGIERMWYRRTRYDHFWPSLAHLGEQQIYQGEIYADGSQNDLGVTFGFAERYAEYRYKPSRISGLFRSSAAQSLDSWHYAEDETAAPTLSSSWILYDSPIDRTIAVPSEPHFILDCWFDLKCARPMPVYGVPGLIDHF